MPDRDFQPDPNAPNYKGGRKKKMITINPDLEKRVLEKMPKKASFGDVVNEALELWLDDRRRRRRGEKKRGD